jgi:hypothetical protein
VVSKYQHMLRNSHEELRPLCSIFDTHCPSVYICIN